MNIIQYKIKNIYGNNLIYIVSPHKKAIECLLKKKTIDSKDMANLIELGFSFKQVL